MSQKTETSAAPRPSRDPEAVSTIALVGFMGAGKTTVGRALAEHLGWQFADLDDLIESREKRTIPQIFEENREAGFRNLEHEVLLEFLDSPQARFFVLALGGGAFVTATVREALLARSVPAVWLDAPPEELFLRCEQPGVVRPLRKAPRQFQELYDQRLSSYRQADIHVVTSGKEISGLVDEIIVRLALPKASRSAE